VQAGLLDLLRGGSANDLALDPEGEQLKQWLMQRGLPQQKVGLQAGKSPQVRSSFQ
jgi:hypothetical protein